MNTSFNWVQSCRQCGVNFWHDSNLCECHQISRTALLVHHVPLTSLCLLHLLCLIACSLPFLRGFPHLGFCWYRSCFYIQSALFAVMLLKSGQINSSFLHCASLQRLPNARWTAVWDCITLHQHLIQQNKGMLIKEEKQKAQNNCCLLPSIPILQMILQDQQWLWTFFYTGLGNDSVILAQTTYLMTLMSLNSIVINQYVPWNKFLNDLYLSTFTRE
jgi:hypothetical protein